MNWKIHNIESCPSTNSLLKKWLLEDKSSHKEVIIANNQTQGRGRFDRVWEAPIGNLNMSLAFSIPHMNQLSLLNLLAGLVICHTLKNHYLVKTKIKWPNDVFIQQKKFSGILSEFVPDKKTVVIGMGCNINSLIIDFSKELQPTLTTLRECTQKEWDLDVFAKQLLQTFDTLYEAWQNNSNQWLINEVQNKLIWLNENVIIHQDKKTIRGKLKGLDENGFLLIEKDDKNVETIVSGDVLPYALSLTP